MGRAPCCEKLGLKKGRWTAEEDEILTKHIEVHGEGSWRSLPKNAGLLRCGKSCRLRWINYLRADLKRGNITAEEEETIVKLHNVLGNRWSLIAEHLQGRTDNEIKNYWNSHLSRKIYTFSKQLAGEETSPTPTIINADKIAQRRRRTSTSTIKKNIKSTKKDQDPTSKSSPDQKPPTPCTILGQVGESNNSTVSSGLRGKKNVEEYVILGPEEGLDREIKQLNYGVEGGGVLEMPSGNNLTLKEEKENGDKWLYNCSSSCSSSLGFDDGPWLDWNWAAGFEFGHNNGNGEWDFLDDGERVFSLWENGNSEGDHY
ncbi:hypothetical protein UlMin_009625 [Ulmus minor]